MRIAAVSYVNTLPLLEGLRNSGIRDKIEIIPVVPSRCAEMLLNDEVDISLCPVAALKEMDHYQILTDYCIGCDGAVRTVALYSNSDFDEIEKVYLDPASRTSNQLIQILAKEHWKTDWDFTEPLHRTSEEIKSGEAVLAIGDKAFAFEKQYLNHWDLGTAWKNYVNLPFVFAVWASKKSISKEFEQQMNAAFEIGVNSIPELSFENDRYRDYLTNNISFDLDKRKIEALQIFLNRLNPAYSEISRI